MKTSRLKNIVIVVLALANAFLLVLLLSRRAQERAANERAVTQLVALYASNGITLPAAIVPDDVRLSAVEPARDLDAEADFAAAVLGGCSAEDVGGGIYRYVGSAGQCLLRSSGAVEAALDRSVSDPEAFCDGICIDRGYELTYAALSDGSGTVHAIRRVSDGVVFNATLEFTFSQNRLLAVTGFFLPAVETAGGDDAIDAVTALVRFLDYSNLGGEVCTEITGVQSGYLLQSTASASLRLIPAWRVTTDVNQYYVNMISGEVTRES